MSRSWGAKSDPGGQPTRKQDFFPTTKRNRTLPTASEHRRRPCTSDEPEPWLTPQFQPGKVLSQRPTSLEPQWKCEMINLWCFRLLNLWEICYTAIENQYNTQPPESNHCFLAKSPIWLIWVKYTHFEVSPPPGQWRICTFFFNLVVSLVMSSALSMATVYCPGWHLLVTDITKLAINWRPGAAACG